MKVFRCTIGEWTTNVTARTWQEAAQAAARIADGDLEFRDGEVATIEVFDGTRTILADVVVHDLRTYDVEYSRDVSDPDVVELYDKK